MEAITIKSTTSDTSVDEILRKITGVEKVQQALAAEYIFLQDGRLSTYSADHVEETCQVLTHALSTGADLLGVLGIDATGSAFIATFGVGAPANELVTKDVLAFKDAFLMRHAELLRDPSPEVEKDAKHDE
jgi:hypothetical protein